VSLKIGDPVSLTIHDLAFGAEHRAASLHPDEKGIRQKSIPQ
jgi:hypothetical protein